jgi:hypothetical protein
MHTNKVNDKKYIGITAREPEVRWGGRGNGYAGNIQFAGAIKKYGWDGFKHIILFEGLTRDAAIAKEIELIEAYDSFRNGYNRDLGGYMPSERHRRAISKAQIGRVRTKEERQLLSDSIKGRCFVNKNGVNRQIQQQELDEHLEVGWILGLSISKENNQKKKEKLSKIVKGKKYITKDCVCKMVREDEIKKYLAEGWVEGRYFSKKGNNKGRRYINDGETEKIVAIKKIEAHLLSGWALGKLDNQTNAGFTTKGLRHIHKDSRHIMVSKTEVEEYLHDGWNLGFVPKNKS